jgi:hypothetical protein
MHDGPKTATSSVQMLVEAWKGDGKEMERMFKDVSLSKERIDGIEHRVIC